MDILGNNPEIPFDQDLNTTDSVSFDTVSSNAFIKNGGTDIQYLMADGTVLTSSANSGNSNFYLYDNTNSAVDTTPIAGEVIINNASNPLATFVYISHITRDNIDVEVFWQFVNQLTDLYIQDQNDSGNYVRYNITGVPNPITGNKIEIPVSYLTSDGTGDTAFGAGHNIMVSYFTNTLETDTRLSALETKTTNQTFNAITGTTWSGVGNFANLNSPIIDSATTIAFGNTTQTGMTIGRVGAVVNIRASQINTTGTILPTVTNVNNIGSGTLLYNTIFGSIIGTNTIDVPISGSPLSIGGISASTLTIGRVGTTTTLQGSQINTNGNILPTVTNVNNIGSATFIYNTIFGSIIGTNAIDVPVGGTNITIGNTSANSITIGRATQTVSFPGSILGSLTVATSVLTPLINTATAVAMNIGTATHTALTVGRNNTANTLIQGLAILNQNVPFISSVITTPTTSNSRLSLSKFIMPTNLTNSTFGTFIMTGVSGSMGSVNTVTNEQIVGSTWRYRFSGNVANAVNTNTLSFQITHGVSLTQNIATWTYTNATTNGNFNAEIILFFSVIGATSTVIGSGYVNFVNGTTSTILNVGLNSFSPVYNSTLANANGCQIVASPATGFLYGVNNFTVEWLR
jgi:hypothetical protein